jgi:hypothetical protein
MAGFQVRSRVEPVGIDDSEVMDAVYRLVQESLTNAMRHSGGRRISIDIRHLNGENVDVLIADDGVADDAAEERAGLTGLRERVTALGGQLNAGPAERGWQVKAALPLAGGRSSVGGALPALAEQQEAAGPSGEARPRRVPFHGRRRTQEPARGSVRRNRMGGSDG